jgi:sterol 3beta-glucosyltransferase
MTQITIVASGSRGDVQPYIALGKGLSDAGYGVRLLASENFASLATEAGLDFASTGISVEDISQTPEWRAVIESGNFIKILGKMQTEMRRHAADSARLLPPLLQGSKLIVAGMAGLGLQGIAKHYKIPMVQAYVFPITPTADFAAPLLKRSLGGLLNRLSFWLTQQMLWQSSKAITKSLHQIENLPKVPFWGPFSELARQSTPTLYGYSRHVLPRPRDWPTQTHVTGYWFLDAQTNWTPPADLVAFLKAGPAPVYIGFGSMGSSNPQQAGEIALEALARSGQRGVLAAGWGGLQVKDVPNTVHMISSLPHSWLLPQMAAVVHHGGAGTTAAGLRAGVPSVIVPFMADQPFWGARLQGLGVSPKPIPRKQLTSTNLAQAITTAVSDREMRQRARVLGEQICAEDGIGQAVRLITQAIP